MGKRGSPLGEGAGSLDRRRVIWEEVRMAANSEQRLEDDQHNGQSHRMTQASSVERSIDSMVYHVSIFVLTQAKIPGPEQRKRRYGNSVIPCKINSENASACPHHQSQLMLGSILSSYIPST